MMVGEKPYLLLAPMAGVTHRPFRVLAREEGAQITITEMVHARGLLEGNRGTEELIDLKGEEGITGLQLFGNDPSIMARAARRAWEVYRPCFLDINMGCPTPKIVKQGMGAALMRDPERAKKMVVQVVKSFPNPVTVKMRLGWQEGECNALTLALYCEEAGAAAVTVHGRTRDQFYSGKASWNIIGQIKDTLTIPVVGNGDIDSPETALKRWRETGCDGLMIGRGAQGNPWIFRQIQAALSGETPPPPPGLEERIPYILRHARMLMELRGNERRAALEMRKHLGWYIRGLPGARSFRAHCMQVESLADIESCLQEFKPLE